MEVVPPHSDNNNLVVNEDVDGVDDVIQDDGLEHDVQHGVADVDAADGVVGVGVVGVAGVVGGVDVDVAGVAYHYH